MSLPREGILYCTQVYSHGTNVVTLCVIHHLHMHKCIYDILTRCILKVLAVPHYGMKINYDLCIMQHNEAKFGLTRRENLTSIAL